MGNSVLISETAVQKLGWDDPIGKKLEIFTRQSSWTVVGVVKDFHMTSLHRKIEPTFILRGEDPKYFSARINIRDISGTLDFIRSSWEEINPGLPFEYKRPGPLFPGVNRWDWLWVKRLKHIS